MSVQQGCVLPPTDVCKILNKAKSLIKNVKWLWLQTMGSIAAYLPTPVVDVRDGTPPAQRVREPSPIYQPLLSQILLN